MSKRMIHEFEEGVLPERKPGESAQDWINRFTDKQLEIFTERVQKFYDYLLSDELEDERKVEDATI